MNKTIEGAQQPITLEMKREGLQMTSSTEQVAMAVKTYRLRQGLTQQQLAERWGMSRFTILRCEAAKKLSWEMSYRIFAALSQDLEKEGR